MKPRAIVVIMIPVILSILGCHDSKSDKGPAGAATCPVASRGSIESVSLRPIEGTVIQTLAAGRYVYVELNTGTGSVWIAAVAEPVEKGDHVSAEPQTVMSNFESPTLKRTFDRVYFVGSLTTPRSKGAMPANHPTMQSAHGANAAIEGTLEEMNVSPAEGGVTVAQLVAQREELAGTEVLLRGKVTKYNANIMDANWIHVRDGSDKQDLVVATKAEVTLGATVLIRGRLERDVDLGHGYFYDLIIRNAEVTVEEPVQP